LSSFNGINPRAPREWGWQYVFPSRKLSADPRSGAIRRHHLDEDVLQRAIKAAARNAGVRAKRRYAPVRPAGSCR
jgi:integrase